MIFLMDLPKPVHGMSNVNLAVLNTANALNLKHLTLNTVPSYASRLFNTRLWGGAKILHTFFCFFYFSVLSITNIKGVVYRPINGGYGQMYDLVYITLCRLFLNKIYIHHHSFNYLNKKSLLFTLLNKVMGQRSIHVVLGPRMGERLSTIYGVKPEQIELLSNVAFFKKDKIDVVAAHKELMIGHLANLCVDKGIDVFAGLCRELKARNVLFRAKIAGPFADVGSENVVKELLLELDEVEYLGSVYGDDKEIFFQLLDVFVFPSKYANEAEPLVLYEAAQYGVLNIGTQRGCMQDVIRQLQGLSFPEDKNLVINLADSICESSDTGALNNIARKDRIDEFKLMQSQAQKSLSNLIARIEEGGRNVSKT